MKQPIMADMHVHLLCYLVASALASHALTKTCRIEHVVESSRIWLTKNRARANWLERIILGQLALKVARERALEKAVGQREVQSLFTHDMTLNYGSPLVGLIWQHCSDALSGRR
jgi:hypothetical protein